MPYTCEVFGVSAKVNNYSYVDRANLDTKFKRYLRRDVHIAIKGASKCGKSWLRQKCLDDPIVVQCRLGTSTQDIYKQALSMIDVDFDMEKTKSSVFEGKLTGTGQLNTSPHSKIGFESSGSFSNENTTNFGVQYSTSIENLQFVADAIKESGRRLVIEDFHYLANEARKSFAHDLKTLWDFGCFVIIVGVWSQTNLLASMNHDLSGRIEEISVSWSNDDLNKVIQCGSEALNIWIDDSICEKLVADSFYNIGILQSLLLKLVEDVCNIEETAQPKRAIANIDLYNEAAREYANQLDGVYQQFASQVSSGIRKRKDSTGIYALAMEAIVSAEDSQLINGYSRDDIFSVAYEKEPRIKKGNLRTVLKKIVEIQQRNSENSLVIIYDDAIDAVLVMDYQLLFYRKHHTMKWPWEKMIKDAQKTGSFNAEEDE